MNPTPTSRFYVSRDRAEEIRKPFGSYYHYLKGFCNLRKFAPGGGDVMVLGDHEVADAHLQVMFALIDGKSEEDFYLATMLLLGAFAQSRGHTHPRHLRISALKNYFDKLVFDMAAQTPQNTQNTTQKA